MTSGILVSAVITTRNCADLLPGAVRSTLAQKGVNRDAISQDIIVADDASTDKAFAASMALASKQPHRVQYGRYALLGSPLHALKSPLLWRALHPKGATQ